MSKVSDCCGAEPITVEEQRGDRIRQSNSEDNGICPACMEDCEYVDEDDECEECGGHGELPLGHPSDPDCDYYPCPECDKRDPDTRDR